MGKGAFAGPQAMKGSPMDASFCIFFNEILIRQVSFSRKFLRGEFMLQKFYNKIFILNSNML